MLASADRIVQHDFSRGAWFPKKVVDVAYSVEFLEHLAVEHLDNVMATFKSARYIIIAASKNGGHYHANVHFKCVLEIGKHMFISQSVVHMMRCLAASLPADLVLSQIQSGTNRYHSSTALRCLLRRTLSLRRLTPLRKSIVENTA